MESARNREAEILTADYRMNADRGPSKRGTRIGELIPPSPGPLPQERVVRAATGVCEMQEMMGRRSRWGTAVNQAE